MIQRAELELTGKSVKVFKMTRAYEGKKDKARGLFKGVEVFRSHILFGGLGMIHYLQKNYFYIIRLVVRHLRLP